MKSGQIKFGIVLSYLNLILNMFVHVFFTPFLISSLGDAEYGVYRVVMSFIGQLSIMTLGIATLTTRNIVYFDTKKLKKEKENFLAMALIISLVLAVVVFIAGMVMYSGTENIFKNSLSSTEIETAKKLVCLFTLNISFTIINDLFAGMLTGHEKFVQSNLIKTARLILRIVTLIVLLKLGFKSVAIVATDLLLTLIVLAFNMIYGMGVLGEKIKFHFFDKKIFLESILFSSAILLQAIINQVNQNLDSFILGVMTNAETVAVYSIGLTVFTTYNSIPTAITSIFTPKITRMIANGATNNELTDFVSKVGRYQLMICGVIISAFILFGREFLGVWINEKYLPAYEITLLLIIPATIPLIQNCCNSILDAQLKRMSRSLILGFVAIANVIFSIFFVKQFGYIGAAYGTALSLIIGNVIIMNIYLHKKIGLNIPKMFKDIFNRLLFSIIGAAVISIPLRRISVTNTPMISIMIKIVLFVIIYAIIIYIFGMNKIEKDSVKNAILKFVKRRK